MSTFLFVWNPAKWDWHELDEKINLFRNTGTATEKWSCVSYKKIKEGDRAFLLQLGKETKQKGVFASGIVASEPFLSPHWADKNKLIYRVYIEFDALFHPSKENILEIDLLQGHFPQQTWLPQNSGIAIKDEIIDELEALWFSVVKNKAPSLKASESRTVFTEGTKTETLRTSYERNPHARKVCLEHYGYSCQVCGMNFEERYGKIGKNFIHVHHQSMISSADGEQEVDPVKDLIPVCPNCHAMLHKQKPPFSMKELQEKLLPIP